MNNDVPIAHLRQSCVMRVIQSEFKNLYYLLQYTCLRMIDRVVSSPEDAEQLKMNPAITIVEK